MKKEENVKKQEPILVKENESWYKLFMQRISELAKRFRSPARTIKRGTIKERPFNNRKVTKGRKKVQSSK